MSCAWKLHWMLEVLNITMAEDALPSISVNIFPHAHFKLFPPCSATFRSSPTSPLICPHVSALISWIDSNFYLLWTIWLCEETGTYMVPNQWATWWVRRRGNVFISPCFGEVGSVSGLTLLFITPPRDTCAGGRPELLQKEAIMIG